MDHLSEYAAMALVKERHRQLIAEARGDAILRARPPRGRRVRVSLGTALIRVGAWLLREEYARAQ